MSFSKPQRGVIVGASTALVISLAVLVAAATFGTADGAADTSTRQHLFAACILGPVMTFAACIGRLANHRFHTPADIDGSGLTAGTDRAKVLQALLQNTLEQLVLALATYAAWAALAPARMLHVLPDAALLFVAGRLLFFRGYGSGAPQRALGFGLTFYPTLMLLIGSIAFAIRGWVG